MTEELDYSAYTPLSRDELLQMIQQHVSERRFKHILGVERTAIRLARHYHADVTKASLAALVHDYGKEAPDAIYEALMTEHHQTSLAPYGNNIWHGKLGIYLIEKDLHIHDADILHAVSVHTTGSAAMNTLDKIIFIADYIEPGRKFEGVHEARELAMTSLDDAVRYSLRHTLVFLINQNHAVFPETLQAYNHWNAGME